MFDEHSETARELVSFFELCLVAAVINYEVTLKEPAPVVSKRLLNEIMEFKPADQN